MSGPDGGEEIREGSTRAQTRAVNQEAAVGLISVIGPCDGGRIFHAQRAAQEVGGEPTKLLGCLAKRRNRSRRRTPQRVRQGIRAYGRRRFSRRILMAQRPLQLSLRVIPKESNIVDSNWLLKWKGDEHGMIDSLGEIGSQGHSRVERVDYFDTFAPTASTMSNRLVPAMACKLD